MRVAVLLECTHFKRGSKRASILCAECRVLSMTSFYVCVSGFARLLRVYTLQKGSNC